MKKEFIKYTIVIVLLPLWIFFIVPEIEPKQNFEQTYIQRGTDQIVSTFDGELSKPYVLEETITQHIIFQSNGIFDIQGKIVGTDLADDSTIFEHTTIFHVDSATSKHVDESLGYFAFPRNVEKKDYFMTHFLLANPTNYEYQQTEKIFDLTTYKFTCTGMNQDATAGFPQFAPHRLTMDYNCDIWVEPITGNVVKHKVIWFTYFVKDGKKDKLAEIGGTETTNHTIDILTDLTKTQLLSHFFIQVLGPITTVAVIGFMVSYDIKKKSGAEINKERKLRKQLSEQIAVQENLRKALDASSIVIILNDKGSITFVNDKFCKLSKYSKNELIGKDHKILYSGDHHNTDFSKNIWYGISNGKIWSGEICVATKDGSFFWTQSTIVPFCNSEGKINEYVLIQNDISEQKNLAKQLVNTERLSAIGELSARISHDIRNPLTILVNEFSLLKQKKLLGEKNSKRIGESLRRITHQLDEVLDYVRMTPLVISNTHLNSVLKKAISNLIISSDVQLTLPENEIFMNADAHKIQVVFLNLIYNSLQSIGNKGTIDIHMNEDDEKISIQIIDSGPGVPDYILPNVFDPLVTSKQQGTGLGLASVRNIVIQHHGIITVKNNPTTFTIEFPKGELN